MIIFFGPAGSGKSVQGQILAARQGWRWLSAGQLLRDTHDQGVLGTIQSGILVDDTKMSSVISNALENASGVSKVILDGFPRSVEQARWLVKNQLTHKRSISLVFVLDVSKDELIKRLKLRGRVDDTEEAINERLDIYSKEIDPILSYFNKENIKIIHINGVGSVEQIHNQILESLRSCKLA